MKTQNEILSDFYKIIKASPIDGLDGGVYKKIRPNDSEKEDCVFHIISGNSAKFVQDGALYVKIFYKDLLQNNSYFENTSRGQVLEQMLIDLSETLLKSIDYTFYVQSRETYTEMVEEIHQHYAILKINYKSL